MRLGMKDRLVVSECLCSEESCFGFALFQSRQTLSQGCNAKHNTQPYQLRFVGDNSQLNNSIKLIGAGQTVSYFLNYGEEAEAAFACRIVGRFSSTKIMG